MFSKAKPAQTAGSGTDAARPAPKNAVPSIISADLRVNGNLISGSDIQVDGWVQGDIQSRTVIIGLGATVHGAVQAETVRVCGTVNGQIKGDSVVLEKTARVTGDVLHKTLAIEEGAQLEGMCKRIESAASVQAVSAAANESTSQSTDDKPLADRLAAIR